jgi:hypothetical protein
LNRVIGSTGQFGERPNLNIDGLEKFGGNEETRQGDQLYFVAVCSILGIACAHVPIKDARHGQRDSLSTKMTKVGNFVQQCTQAFAVGLVQDGFTFAAAAAVSIAQVVRSRKYPGRLQLGHGLQLIQDLVCRDK